MLFDEKMDRKIDSTPQVFAKRLTNMEQPIDWQETLSNYGQSLTRKDILNSIVNGMLLQKSSYLQGVSN